MDDSKPDRSSDKGAEASKVVKEDTDANTPNRDVKGPKIIGRLKEEFEAVVDAIHQLKEDKSRGSPKHHKETHGRGEDIDPDTQVSEFKGPNIFHRAKEEFEAIVDTINSKRESDRDAASDHKGSPSHRKEDIDADIPTSEFKGPNIFHRAKEEIEALVDIINSKKESDNDPASPKKDGFRASISKKLQRNRNRD